MQNILGAVASQVVVVVVVVAGKEETVIVVSGSVAVPDDGKQDMSSHKFKRCLSVYAACSAKWKDNNCSPTSFSQSQENRPFFVKENKH